MADSTLDSELFVLIDQWPDGPTLSVPPHGTILSAEAGHDVAAAKYAKGTKFKVFNDGTVGAMGWSTFIYLNWVVNANVAFAAKQVATVDTNADLFIVTNDPDHCLDKDGGMAVVVLSAVTTTQYGWGWCGGVCPEQLVAGLGGNFATVNDVAIGPFVAHDLAGDAIGLGLPADDGTELVFGYSLSADA